jgi:hypothetical protein
MESPQTGWRTRHGRPPLALTLHYLLSADPGELSENGNETPPAHDALTSTMMLFHERGILTGDTVVTSGPARTVRQLTTALDGLVEPVRITMDTIPLETVTALWSSGDKALRVSVGYEVSLVTVVSPTPFAPGPPVLERVVAVSPSNGPRISGVDPESVSFGVPLRIAATGLGGDVDVTLSRLDGDSDDPTDGRPDPGNTHSTGPWHLSASRTPQGLLATLPNRTMVPGKRALEVTNRVGGLSAGSDGRPVVVVPAILSADGPLVPGDAVTLEVAHVRAEGTVVFGGLTASYVLEGPTSVSVIVPAGVAGWPVGQIGVSIRCGTVAGAPTLLAVS